MVLRLFFGIIFIKAVFWQVDDKISWVIFCLINVRIREMGNNR